MEKHTQEANVISEYTLSEAIADGVLYPLGRANSLPLIGTVGVVTDLEPEEREGLFKDYLVWERDVMPSLKEEDRMFGATASNGQRVWVINDGAAITLLYPSEY